MRWHHNMRCGQNGFAAKVACDKWLTQKTSKQWSPILFIKWGKKKFQLHVHCARTRSTCDPKFGYKNQLVQVKGQRLWETLHAMFTLFAWHFRDLAEGVLVQVLFCLTPTCLVCCFLEQVLYRITSKVHSPVLIFQSRRPFHHRRGSVRIAPERDAGSLAVRCEVP